jgi:hypothetical protein
MGEARSMGRHAHLRRARTRFAGARGEPLGVAGAVVCGLVVAAAVGLVPPASAATERAPLLEAAFAATSYVPGERAELVVRTRVRRLELQVIRAGAERGWSSVGRPWGPPRAVMLKRGLLHRLSVRPGAWQSGLYFVRLTAPGGRAVAFAPFVLRAAVPGRNRVAIVLPTYTWQAYNFYDANGDGKPDSWYGDRLRHSVTLGRPYSGPGKPPHYRTDQRGFIRFLVHTGKQADYLTDEDLERVASGDDLARLYDLVIFSGHEEYVTAHSYDIVERYRDLGGNLAFLSANNFFRRVVRSGNRLWRGGLWRQLGRPEAGLIGVQYSGNDRGGHAAPYVVLSSDAAPWLFSGLTVTAGSTLSSARYGIEFDSTTTASPPGTAVVAEVNSQLRGGLIRGQMSYYETGAGARVFAAGTLSFAGSDNPVGGVLFENIWTQLSKP